MAGNMVKEMTTNFGKLDKFEGHDFRRWHKKMQFLLTTLKVVYVLTTPMPELLEDATVDTNRCMNPINSVYMSSSTVINFSLWHARLGHVHYKRMLEISKDDLIPAIDENPGKCTTCDASRFCYVYLLHTKDEALDKFRIYKTEVKLQQNDLVKTLRTDRGGEYYDLVFFQSVGIIHESTALYTSHQNGVAERKNRALKEMVNSMLSYSGLSEGAVVRLPDAKHKILGKKGIDCIFVGYAAYSKAYSYTYLRDQEIKLDYNTLTVIVLRRILEPIMKLCNLEILLFGKKQLTMRLKGIDYFDTYAPVARITTIRLFLSLVVIHNLVIHQMDVKIAFLNGDLEEEVYMKQPEGFVIPDCSPVSTPMDQVEKVKLNTGKHVDQLEYLRSIGCLMYAMTRTRLDIAYAVGRLSRECAISCASKKLTCITGSTIEYEFVVLVAAGKEAEWLRNLIHEILIWPKPIAPISIRCDSALTMDGHIVRYIMGSLDT
uniref:Zinc finger, CCHC-type n=1 Tax=Tanacetum cinerariifolium TaxID=118510 RepID=A0A6L2P5Z9_TANCI|nr:zinc finger, CCHC-type [Tanacetum cinerariifolium]